MEKEERTKLEVWPRLYATGGDMTVTQRCYSLGLVRRSTYPYACHDMSPSGSQTAGNTFRCTNVIFAVILTKVLLI
jgi:hypothetical protein